MQNAIHIRFLGEGLVRQCVRELRRDGLVAGLSGDGNRFWLRRQPVGLGPYGLLDDNEDFACRVGADEQTSPVVKSESDGTEAVAWTDGSIGVEQHVVAGVVAVDGSQRFACRTVERDQGYLVAGWCVSVPARRGTEASISSGLFSCSLCEGPCLGNVK